MLAQARGEIVTKDELLEAVWPGTIVEENALQAQIVSLRKALGPEAERLKTIRGVGYRLNVDSGAATPPMPTAERQTLAPPRRQQASSRWSATRLAGLVVLALALAGAAWTASNLRTNLGDMVRVQALSASGGEQAQLLARSLDGEIVNVLNESGIETRSGRPNGGFPFLPQSDLRFEGSVLQDGSRLTVDLRLADVPRGTVLWSRRFEGDRASSETLATEVSAAAVRTIYTIQEMKLQKGIEVDTATIALYLRAAELVRSRQLGDEGTPLQIYERIVAREPRLAAGHAMLALTMLNEFRARPSEVQLERRGAIRREAARAIEIDPVGAGAAYDALYFLARLERPRDYAAAERWLLEGLRAAPDFAYLWMRECRFLTGTGRVSDALPYCQRALAKHPFSEPIGHSYATTLWASGDYSSARDTIARAAVTGPDHAVTRAVQFELAAFGGNKSEALRLLDEGTIPPAWARADGIAVLRRYLATAAATPAEREALAAELYRLGRSGDLEIDWAIMALTTLGDRDKAFDLLNAPELEGALTRGGGFLFLPVTRPLRADPRFFPLAARLGIAQYWVSTGKWPDMCGAEYEAASCKLQIRKALGSA